MFIFSYPFAITALTIIKSFFIWFLSLFFKNKTAEEIKSINAISKLIVADNYDFEHLFEKTTVIESLKILKIALALKRNLCHDKNFEKTGIHCVDIYIIKKDLQKSLKNGDLNSAINFASKIIRNYPDEINVVKEEILEVAKRAKRNLVAFNFDPSKFKYNLPQSFINEYSVELGLVSFEIANDNSQKLKILERLHRDYPANIDILCKLLDFVFENDSEKYDEKKIADLLKETLSLNPNRKITKYILRIKRNDIFELAQSMMTAVSDNNLEKLWILLEIATEKQFANRAKELLQKIIEIDKSSDIFKFFVEYFEFLSSIPEINNLIRKVKS